MTRLKWFLKAYVEELTLVHGEKDLIKIANFDSKNYHDQVAH